jgi:hypothetical protein
MKITEAFPGNFIKASDLQGKEVTVTMDEVRREELGQGADKETKPVLYFKGKERGLVLNKTNANAITEMYGDETDDWHGKKIVLVARFVEFQGKEVEAIRIKRPTRHVEEDEPPAREIEQPVRRSLKDQISDDIPFMYEWR